MTTHLGDTLATALRDPSVGGLLDDFAKPWDFLAPYFPGQEEFPLSWVATAVLDARYKGYLEKEERLAARVDKSDRLRIPEDFDFRAVPGLSKEAMEKLEGVRPLTLGQASRVPGVRKSDAALLYVVLARR
jgi:tRNA uridine 5-carboxymethylaminomethyl modification enzyme